MQDRELCPAGLPGGGQAGRPPLNTIPALRAANLPTLATKLFRYRNTIWLMYRNICSNLFLKHCKTLQTGLVRIGKSYISGLVVFLQSNEIISNNEQLIDVLKHHTETLQSSLVNGLVLYVR